MRSVVAVILQLVAYTAFAIVVGYLSASPDYRYSADNMATIKLSLSHAAERVQPCVRLTPQEVAELAPNMRQELRCERERLPLAVELEIDGDVMISVIAEPSGLWNDGPASVYARREIAPGPYVVTARLRDTARAEGWDYVYRDEVVLDAGRYLTVTFRAETGGFSFR